jgi:hypothetical protein
LPCWSFCCRHCPHPADAHAASRCAAPHVPPASASVSASTFASAFIPLLVTMPLHANLHALCVCRYTGAGAKDIVSGHACADLASKLQVGSSPPVGWLAGWYRGVSRRCTALHCNAVRAVWSCRTVLHLVHT